MKSFSDFFIHSQNVNWITDKNWVTRFEKYNLVTKTLKSSNGNNKKSYKLLSKTPSHYKPVKGSVSTSPASKSNAFLINQLIYKLRFDNNLFYTRSDFKNDPSKNNAYRGGMTYESQCLLSFKTLPLRKLNILLQRMATLPYFVNTMSVNKTPITGTMMVTIKPNTFCLPYIDSKLNKVDLYYFKNNPTEEGSSQTVETLHKFEVSSWDYNSVSGLVSKAAEHYKLTEPDRRLQEIPDTVERILKSIETLTVSGAKKELTSAVDKLLKIANKSIRDKVTREQIYATLKKLFKTISKNLQNSENIKEIPGSIEKLLRITKEVIRSKKRRADVEAILLKAEKVAKAKRGKKFLNDKKELIERNKLLRNKRDENVAEFKKLKNLDKDSKKKEDYKSTLNSILNKLDNCLDNQEKTRVDRNKRILLKRKKLKESNPKSTTIKSIWNGDWFVPNLSSTQSSTPTKDLVSSGPMQDLLTRNKHIKLGQLFKGSKSYISNLKKYKTSKPVKTLVHNKSKLHFSNSVNVLKTSYMSSVKVSDRDYFSIKPTEHITAIVSKFIALHSLPINGHGTKCTKKEGYKFTLERELNNSIFSNKESYKVVLNSLIPEYVERYWVTETFSLVNSNGKKIRDKEGNVLTEEKSRYQYIFNRTSKNYKMRGGLAHLHELGTKPISDFEYKTFEEAREQSELNNNLKTRITQGLWSYIDDTRETNPVSPSGSQGLSTTSIIPFFGRRWDRAGKSTRPSLYKTRMDNKLVDNPENLIQKRIQTTPNNTPLSNNSKIFDNINLRNHNWQGKDTVIGKDNVDRWATKAGQYKSDNRNVSWYKSINFFHTRYDYFYTRLKYSRTPAIDIVSGGSAALLAAYLGFLATEKAGFELLDSGDFYTLIMYITFVCFSIKPIMASLTAERSILYTISPVRLFQHLRHFTVVLLSLLGKSKLLKTVKISRIITLLREFGILKK